MNYPEHQLLYIVPGHAKCQLNILSYINALRINRNIKLFFIVPDQVIM